MDKRLLVIDTATTACSVALFENDQLLASEYREIGRGHAEKLIPMIAELPMSGKADSIAVDCGPGSFTGIRIGLSAAKALAMAWKASLSGYQCLHLVAAQALDKMTDKEPVCVTMIGGHGEYLVQNFTSDGSPIDSLASLPLTEVLEYMKANIRIGNAAQDIDGKAIEFAPLPKAENYPKLQAANRIVNIKPIYSRAPDARPNNQSNPDA